MIDENELMRYSGYFADSRQLEKDYLLNLMLKVFSMTPLSNRSIFKGGTAISYFYGLDRFSEDLDFSYAFENDSDINSAIKLVDAGVKKIIADYGFSYTVRKSKVGVTVRDEAGIVIGMRNEFFIEGPMFSKAHMPHKIKLDMSLRRDIINVPKTAERFVSKYPDVGGMLVYVMSKEEILSEKACAIMERDNARDVYDMYFLMKYKGTQFDAGLFSTKVKLRNETFTIQDLKRRIKSFSSSLWKEELSHLLKQLPEISAVKGLLLAGL